ncbi:MAG TPA: presqualene diphosphate synthase HpnD [Terriglobia bacterium]|nr:presqualene diphosphate synthase HpnD [Terriglobia bacterium]
MSAAVQPVRTPTRFTSAAATNFYYSFVLLPREKRRAIESVYAFARRGDDLVDGDLATDEAAHQMARFRELLDECYADGRPSLGSDAEPAIEALAETVHRYPIPRRLFDDLISGLQMDLDRAQYRTFEDLAVYCYRVAGTIGLISIEIFGYRSLQTRDYAVHLGTALQLVNILRDVASDARRGRVYLPDEDLDRFGVKREQLLAARPSEGFAELMRFECDRARHYFDLAQLSLAPKERRLMVAAEIMAAIYWRLLAEIEQRGYNVFGPRIALPRHLKLWIALSVYLGRNWRR